MSTSSDQPVVSLRDVTIMQELRTVLERVNFEIGKGEFAYLVGRTGSGKSSLLKTLYADLPLFSGTATVADFKLHKLQRAEIPFLRRKIGIIFQDFQLLFDRSVAENLFFVMRATGWKDKSKMKQRLSEVLMQVGLSSADNKMPHQLSGGEQQRIVIARAMINEPAIMLADEPTGNLDPEVADDIMKIFRDINHSGTAVLMATHNYNLIRDYPGRVLRCEDGKVTEDGKAAATSYA
ncbi:MAG: ATP-binding cassette domain-containing protein [Moraxellaceae bacterium]|nr:MAG: ATP-binding cassette domain-containing protein [Moraxellaceae bacterium]